MKHRTWKFAVTTSYGIYFGTLEGIQENNESDNDAMKIVSNTVVTAMKRQISDIDILACFVSDKELYISAESGTLINFNIKLDF